MKMRKNYIFACPFCSPFPLRKGGEGDRTPPPSNNSGSPSHYGKGARGIGPHSCDEPSFCSPFPLRKGGEGDRTPPPSDNSDSPSHYGKGLGVRSSSTFTPLE